MIRVKSLPTLALAGLMGSSLMTSAWAEAPQMKMTTPIPESITTPAEVETSIGKLEYFDGVPTKADGRYPQ